VEDLQSAESACTWAQASLPIKNSLIAEDAKIVEEVFEQKLRGFAEQIPPETSAATAVAPTSEPTAAAQESDRNQIAASRRADHPQRIDKSALTLAEPRRYRDREHLRFVTQPACLVCGRKPSDAHHLRRVQAQALGRKPSDEYVVPHCRVHHRAGHRVGDERTWWKQFGVEPIKVARKLWGHTRLGVPPTTDMPSSPKSNDSAAPDAPA
jgi:hypothetical protein